MTICGRKGEHKQTGNKYTSFYMYKKAPKKKPWMMMMIIVIIVILSSNKPFYALMHITHFQMSC